MAQLLIHTAVWHLYHQLLGPALRHQCSTHRSNPLPQLHQWHPPSCMIAVARIAARCSAHLLPRTCCIFSAHISLSLLRNLLLCNKRKNISRDKLIGYPFNVFFLKSKPQVNPIAGTEDTVPGKSPNVAIKLCTVQKVPVPSNPGGTWGPGPLITL
jgi:hypothetical protein